jgi:hypothetical protein
MNGRGLRADARFPNGLAHAAVPVPATQPPMRPPAEPLGQARELRRRLAETDSLVDPVLAALRCRRGYRGTLDGRCGKVC